MFPTVHYLICKVSWCLESISLRTSIRKRRWPVNGILALYSYMESVVVRCRASLSYLQHENVSLGLSKRMEGVNARQPRTRIRTWGRWLGISIRIARHVRAAVTIISLRAEYALRGNKWQQHASRRSFRHQRTRTSPVDVALGWYIRRIRICNSRINFMHHIYILSM